MILDIKIVLLQPMPLDPHGYRVSGLEGQVDILVQVAQKGLGELIGNSHQVVDASQKSRVIVAADADSG